MKCKLCDKENKLIKAHIIPEFFYKNLKIYLPDKKGQGRLHGYLKKNGILSFLKKGIPKGLYDTEILCKNCDSIILKKFDDFGKEILFDKNLIKKQDISFDNKLKVSILKEDNIDTFKFKLFIASIFWRASISQKGFCSAVNIEKKVELQIKKLLLNQNRMDIYDFGVVILSLNRNLPKDHLTNFIKVDKKGKLFYSFSAGGLIFNFFPKKQLVPDFWKEYTISDGGILKIPIINDIQKSYSILNDFIEEKIFRTNI